MNFLAHAYLSYNNAAVVTGNMISDFVKGKSRYNYPIAIQTGIELHRRIDAFTDSHLVTQLAKQYFKPSVGLYAGAFVDVVYDYFLANDAQIFATQNDLQLFALNTYQQLTQHQQFFPANFAALFPYMQQNNWLYNYQFTWGIEKSFTNIERRAKYLQNNGKAFEVFVQNQLHLQKCYNNFIHDVKRFATEQLQQLNS